MIEFENFIRLLRSDRTVRRFRGDETIDREVLERLVEIARFCHSGRNLQPLRYAIVTEKRERDELFSHLKWAGYFSDWDGPEEGERPVAYLVQCLDTQLGQNCLCDDGLQLQAITLGARTLGIGSCIIKAFNVAGVSGVLGVGARYAPRYVVALGYPAEEVVIEDMDGRDDADFKYFRSPDGVHHVPKRPLGELIIK